MEIANRDVSIYLLLPDTNHQKGRAFEYISLSSILSHKQTYDSVTNIW